MRKDLVLIEIPLPQVTEHDDQSLHSEASHPGVTLLSSNMAEKKIKEEVCNCKEIFLWINDLKFVCLFVTEATQFCVIAGSALI